MMTKPFTMSAFLYALSMAAATTAANTPNDWQPTDLVGGWFMVDGVSCPDYREDYNVMFCADGSFVGERHMTVAGQDASDIVLCGTWKTSSSASHDGVTAKFDSYSINWDVEIMSQGEHKVFNYMAPGPGKSPSLSGKMEEVATADCQTSPLLKGFTIPTGRVAADACHCPVAVGEDSSCAADDDCAYCWFCEEGQCRFGGDGFVELEYGHDGKPDGNPGSPEEEAREQAKKKCSVAFPALYKGAQAKAKAKANTVSTPTNLRS